MTIRKKLFTSFSLILIIIVFIIAIFFYTMLHLNTIYLEQNHRFEQIRKVEKLKEYKNALSWIALDIFIDKRNNEVIVQKQNRLNELFKNIYLLENPLLKDKETTIEKERTQLIFSHFKKIEELIKRKLEKNDIEQFNIQFKPLREATSFLIIEKIDLLQQKLDETEKLKNNFISTIKVELVILLLVAFLLSFIISSKVIHDIQTMLSKLNDGILQLLNNNEHTIQLDIGKNNELNVITANFNQYLKHKDQIIQSREELLRNISHELKTPITKGKFLIEKIKEEKNNNTIQNINDVFCDIEKLTSKLLQRDRLNFISLESSSFKITTLILESLEKLSIDDESNILVDIVDDFEIKGDIYYLNMAIKNLIDNAIKYSTKLPIHIKTANNTLYIQNYGNKLSNDLVYYLQPFTREPNQQQGHGLGLNIVNKILQIHKLKLHYTYEDSYNIFSIKF
ncbi:MAG: HAMP domain-containing histidine kinase [Arcobacteraceae bacterium]|nr:HAMP domain-containing histidine kinase [Arcobacteraceae bacterium]